MAAARGGKTDVTAAVEGVRMATLIDRLSACGHVSMFAAFCGLFILLLIVGVRERRGSRRGRGGAGRERGRRGAEGGE
jgi:hypothetical protein